MAPQKGATPAHSWSSRSTVCKCESTDFSLHGSIQRKHPTHSAGSIVAHTAPCTSVLCSGTLQRHPALSAGFKIWKWERVHPLLHVRRSPPRHSAPSAESTAAPFTMSTIELGRLELRLWTVSFSARELGEVVPAHSSENTFAQIISPEMFLSENFCPKPYAWKRN